MECRQKYSDKIHRLFHVTFQYLPFAAVVADRVFCVHGGLSPLLRSVSDFEMLCKPCEYLRRLFIDLVWSDPNPHAPWFCASTRGVGQLFGEEVLNSFLDQNGLSMLIRSHEPCQQGVDRPFPGSRRCVTVFSTTDYCGLGNSGAMMAVSDNVELKEVNFEMISGRENRKRRVIFPEWILAPDARAASPPDILSLLGDFRMEVEC
jgi:protein phosphatase